MKAKSRGEEEGGRAEEEAGNELSSLNKDMTSLAQAEMKEREAQGMDKRADREDSHAEVFRVRRQRVLEKINRKKHVCTRSVAHDIYFLQVNRLTSKGASMTSCTVKE